MKLKCSKCKREVKDIQYILEASKRILCKPEEYVVEYDVNYNPSTGIFICQDCNLESEQG